MTEYTEEIGEEEIRRKQLIFEFSESLLKKRDEAIEHRAASGIERQWREDEELCEKGEIGGGPISVTDAATGNYVTQRSEQGRRSKAVVNIVRSRTETGAGRFCDIMLPVDGKNWGMKTTPVPELANEDTDDLPAMQAGKPIVDQNGQPAMMRDIKKDMREKAKKRMELMENEIDDQLTESNFNGEERKVIHRAAKLGTGILKGPIVAKNLKKSWRRVSDETGVAHVMTIEEGTEPVSREVSPWNIYPSPDCGNDAKRASYIWEKDLIKPSEVRGLIGVDGYMEDQLREVLMEEPKRVTPEVDKDTNKWSANIDTVSKGMSYELWEYHGDVDKEALIALGCSCEEAVMTSLSASVVFINDRPVRVDLNPLDTGELPYDFFPWCQIEDSPFGIGIPRQLYWIQRIITEGWRAMLDNAGDSSGANVITAAGLKPWDGNFEITGKKGWHYDGKLDDVKKAFAQFQLANNQKDLQALIEFALKFADLETGLPTIFQGEMQEIPETLGATNIVVDSANVGLRQRIKLFDDLVTERHIKRYYDWNMQYNEDDEIKGDYCVDALGVSVLYERDQIAQQMLQMYPMFQDPDFALEIDKSKWIRQLMKNRKLDVLRDPEEVKQAKEKMAQQPQQTDPRLEAAKIRSQTDMQKAQLDQSSDMKELEFKAMEAEKQRQHDAAMKQAEMQLEMIKLANSQNISLESIKAALASDVMKLQTQKELSYNASRAKQVSMPETEPVGKAPAGEAYQK